jgi:hypothetical protein
VEEVLAEVWLDDDHRVIIRLTEWRGNLRFDIRTHFRVGHTFLPTKRGVSIPVTELDAVLAAVETAQAMVAEDGEAPSLSE